MWPLIFSIRDNELSLERESDRYGIDFSISRACCCSLLYSERPCIVLNSRVLAMFVTLYPHKRIPSLDFVHYLALRRFHLNLAFSSTLHSSDFVSSCSLYIGDETLDSSISLDIQTGFDETYLCLYIFFLRVCPRQNGATRRIKYRVYYQIDCEFSLSNKIAISRKSDIKR